MPDTDPLIIDRFEDGGWAVLEVEAGVTMDVPADWLPPDATEGDVLQVETEEGDTASSVRFVMDDSTTEERRDRIRNKLDQLRGQS